MVNDWLNSLDDDRSGAAGRLEGRSEGRPDSRAEGRPDRRPEPSALGALLHYRWMTIGLVLVGLIGGAAAGYLLVAKPTATTIIGIASPATNKALREGVNSDASFQTYLAGRAGFATSQAVLAVAASATGDSVATLLDSVTAKVGSDGSSIVLTATSDSGAKAATIVDAVVKAFIDQDKAQLQAEASKRTDSIKSNQADWVAQLKAGKLTGGEQIALQGSISAGNADIKDLAADLTASTTTYVNSAKIVPQSRLSKVIRNAGIGAAAGLLIAVVIAFGMAEQVAGAAAFRRHSRGAVPAPPHAAERR